MNVIKLFLAVLENMHDHEHIGPNDETVAELRSELMSHIAAGIAAKNRIKRYQNELNFLQVNYPYLIPLSKFELRALNTALKKYVPSHATQFSKIKNKLRDAETRGSISSLQNTKNCKVKGNIRHLSESGKDQSNSGYPTDY